MSYLCMLNVCVVCFSIKNKFFKETKDKFGDVFWVFKKNVFKQFYLYCNLLPSK